MKVIQACYVEPVTLKSFGPFCCVFRWEISNDVCIYNWVKSHYPDEKVPGWRIWVNTDRMIRFPEYRVYLDSSDLAVLFKLTFGGQRTCGSNESL